MLRRACWWFAFALLAVALIAALGWMFGASDPFGHCIHQRKNGQAYQALHEKEFFIIQLFVRTRLNAVCAAHVANVYQGAITALSGIAVAIFTATLWWVTWGMVGIAKEQRIDSLRAISAAEKAALAAVKSAEVSEQALIGLERPIMIIRIEDQPLGWWNPPNRGTEPFPSIIYSFRNYGKTPAIVEYWEISVDRCYDVDDVFGEYAHKEYFTNPVIVPGDGIERQIIDPGFSKDDDIMPSVRLGLWQIYLHGRIVYRDIFEYVHTTYFCWVYHRNWDCMALHGGKKYNYTQSGNPQHIEAAPHDTHHEPT